GIQHDVQAHMDHINLLIMAAFDNAARLVHHILKLPSSITNAGWQRDRWLQSVAARAPALSGLVQPGSPGYRLITILSEFRNTMHGELARFLFSRDVPQSTALDTSVALPRQAGQAVLNAMNALGGQAAWGIVTPMASTVSDTFVRPGPYVQSLLL